MVSSRIILLACLVGLPAVPVDAQTPVNESVLRVSPNPVRLNAASRRQQILVTAIRDGREIDVTREVTLQLASEDNARLSGSVLSAMQDGKTEVVVRFENVTLRVPVVVEGASSIHPVHFVNDVVPLFSKLGCNSGGCHGKASGQNGFKLSVFGFDAKADFASLSRESRGRRIFTGDPENSLLILKAIGVAAHGGGRRCQPGSPDHHLLSNWIRQGMPDRKSVV